MKQRPYNEAIAKRAIAAAHWLGNICPLAAEQKQKYEQLSSLFPEGHGIRTNVPLKVKSK